MTLYQFNMLDEAEQLEAIWDKSTKLAEREDAEFLYILYQIESFYIEEKIQKEGNLRRAFKSFASTTSSTLQPYLDQIDLSRLNQWLTHLLDRRQIKLFIFAKPPLRWLYLRKWLLEKAIFLVNWIVISYQKKRKFSQPGLSQISELAAMLWTPHNLQKEFGE